MQHNNTLDEKANIIFNMRDELYEISSLMGIQNSDQLKTHPQRGALFETWVVSELIKQRFNHGLLSNLYFWRDSQGHEVDVIAELGNALLPIEIKSGQTITEDYFRGLVYWQQLNGEEPLPWLVYAGDLMQTRKHAEIVGWLHIKALSQQVGS